MHISFSPTRSDTALTLLRHGDILTLNGAGLDLSGIPEGATLPREAVDCDWLAGDIERRGGVLHLVLVLPLGPDAPPAARFPAPLILTGDGVVTLPGTPPKEAAE